ncbi:MAG: hypothetical protein KC619_22985 [Myxococcales bacterium]|nr:hypothetical protein [Myxococcales bacterium]
MSGLATIDEIATTRQQAIDRYLQQLLVELQKQASSSGPLTISATLTDGNQTTTVNLPAHPTVFTIVSWNVQTFEATKSLKNPLVNRVINHVLGALRADVCVLLEARAEPYVNMNAIETGLVGSGNWKAASEEDTDEDPDADDLYLADDREDLQDDQTILDDEEDEALIDGGDPLVYLQDGSEITGKLWQPPRRLWVYEAATARFWRMVQDLHRLEKLRAAQKGGKLTKKQEGDLKKLKKRRDGYRSDRRYSAAKHASKEQRSFASDYNYLPKMLKSFCVSDNAQSGAWLERLRQSEHAPLESYYDLRMLADDLTDVDPDLSRVGKDNGRFFLKLKHCVNPSCSKHHGTGDCDTCGHLGPLSVSLSNLRQCIDDLTFYRCNAEETYAVLLRQNVECYGPSSRGVWIADKQVSVKTVASTLLANAPAPEQIDPEQVKVVVGRVLGFADGKAKFYGRCPYRVPIELWLPGASASIMVPLVAFHGPFGKSTLEGIKIRRAAMTEVLAGAASSKGTGTIGEAPFAVVLGDFNLDWAPTESNPSGAQGIANQLYQDFKNVGFAPQIPNGIATSMIALTDRAQAWKSKTSPADFTSSAYDNIFVKGQALQNHVANAAVVDVISYLVDNADEFPLPDDDPMAAKASTLSALALAFYKYRKYVSDHLPVVLDVLVEAMPNGSPMALRVRAQAEAIRKAPTRLPSQHRTVVFEALRSIAVVDPQAHHYGVDQGSTEQDWTATFIGEVEAHESDHIIVACAFSRGFVTDYMRLAVQPPGGTSTLSSFLQTFPVSTTVRLSTYRHRYAD